jgi:hypothetical protein
MKNYVKSTASRNLEYACLAGLAISLILMVGSAIAPMNAIDIMVSDYEHYQFIKERSREVFMHSSLMMLFSMMGLFVSNN